MTEENLCNHGTQDYCYVCALNRRMARLIRSANYVEEKEFMEKLRKEFQEGSED